MKTQPTKGKYSRPVSSAVRKPTKKRMKPKTKRIAVAAILFIVYSLSLCIFQHRATRIKYEELFASWCEEYEYEQIRLAEKERLAQEAAEPPSDEELYAEQLHVEATMLARLLYGIKDNNTDDLRTCCWCVFNRVDSRGYPNTLQGVIDQPKQWMRYSQDNPVMEDLYAIALEELDRWHTGTRPVDPEYVYMSWSSKEVVLRGEYKETSTTKYWSYR
jgi:hypothetical protein